MLRGQVRLTELVLIKKEEFTIKIPRDLAGAEDYIVNEYRITLSGGKFRIEGDSESGEIFELENSPGGVKELKSKSKAKPRSRMRASTIFFGFFALQCMLMVGMPERLPVGVLSVPSYVMDSIRDPFSRFWFDIPEIISPGDSFRTLISPNRQFMVFVEYESCSLTFHHRKGGSSKRTLAVGKCRIDMQEDGNLVAYDHFSQAVWATNTFVDRLSHSLVLDDYGRLKLINSEGRTVKIIRSY